MRPTDEEIRRKREERRAAKAAARERKEEVRIASLPEGVDFVEFPKIARLRREVVITEKIDGTNAAVGITEDGLVYAQSRKRIITPDADNFGFASWVEEHKDALRDELGPGLHFGEWWGRGIQRGYGIDERRFSLFNVGRWGGEDLRVCRVVPLLDTGTLRDGIIEDSLEYLRTVGSAASPGFTDPEGIVIYHRAANQLFKVTLENDESGKEQGA